MSQEYEILSFGRFEKPRSPTPGKGEDLILDFHEGELPVIGVADGASQGRGDLAKVIVAEEFERWKVGLKPGIDVVTAIESFVSQTQKRLLLKAHETREKSVETTLSLVLPYDRVYVLNIGENVCNLFDYDAESNQYRPRALFGAYGTNVSQARMHLGSIHFKPGNLIEQRYLNYFGPPRGGLYRVALGSDGMYAVEGGRSEFMSLSRNKPAEVLARQLRTGAIPLEFQTDDMAFIGFDLKYLE